MVDHYTPEALREAIMKTKKDIKYFEDQIKIAQMVLVGQQDMLEKVQNGVGNRHETADNLGQPFKALDETLTNTGSWDLPYSSAAD